VLLPGEDREGAEAGLGIEPRAAGEQRAQVEQEPVVAAEERPARAARPAAQDSLSPLCIRKEKTNIQTGNRRCGPI
jgi:hypothetical protein